jgi:glycosyltransferase involved in cell wall biosynthesis
MSTLRLCVITSTYNRAETYLPECIESVRNQILEDSAGQPIEYRHVIVNDASSDSTAEFLDEIARQDPQHIRIVHSKHNSGPTSGMILGTMAVFNESSELLNREGRPAIDTIPHYFIPLDDDDMLTPKAFQIYANACREEWRKRRKLPGMIFGPAILIDASGREITGQQDIDYNNIPPTEDRESFIRAMLECNHLPSKPAFSFWNFCPQQTPRDFVCWDWAIIMHALAHRASYHQVADPTSYYRLHDSQISLKHREARVWEAERKKIVQNMNPLLVKYISTERGVPASYIDTI